jgi:predicted SAM-dependent methyltransferase
MHPKTSRPERAVAVLRRLARRVREAKLKRALRAGPRRIVIGAGGLSDPGWVATDVSEFDLLRPESWEAYVSPASIDALLAEHVWEHLSFAEGRVAAATCYRFLKPGGRMRLAVPDGYFPDPAFQAYIGVSGVAGGEAGAHKVVYTYRSFPEVFEAAGFRTTLLEYHDEHGVFHHSAWDPAEGLIRRSRRFDPRGPISIVLDALKSKVC